jgi:hypothetical protein
LCSRHYRQERRGVLGRAKSYTPAGEASEYNVRLPIELRDALANEAALQGREMAEIARAAFRAYLAACKRRREKGSGA